MRLILQKTARCCQFIELPLDLIQEIAEQAAFESGFGVVETVEFLPSSSRLVDVPTDDLPNGALMKVLSVEDLWQLVKSPTTELLTLAGTTPMVAIESVANPGEVWIRLELGSNRWRSQTTWFIDPINGNEENTGASLSTAIQTFREFSRRMGPAGEIPATMDITLASDVAAGDTLILRSLLIRPDAMLRFHGTPTTLDSGTFTAVTNLDSATQTAPRVTDAAQDFSTYLQRRIRIVGGPRDGACAIITKIVTANTEVRTSAWSTNNTAAVPYDPNVVLINPVIGDAYVIESLPIIRSAEVQVSKVNQGTQGSEGFLFESLQLGGNSNDRFNFGDTNASVAKSIINLRNWYGRDLHIQCGVAVINSTTFHLYNLNFRACSILNNLNTHHGATVFMRDQTMAQGFPLMNITNGALCEVLGDGAAAFDSATDGITVDDVSLLRLTSLLWGNANTGRGIRCDNRALYVAANKPTITGTAADTRIGGTDIAYAGIPVGPNASNGAQLAVRPT